MFPRVLGYLAARAAEQAYEFFNDNPNRQAVAETVVQAAAFAVLPPVARPLALAYRVWSLFQPEPVTLYLNNPRPQLAPSRETASGLNAGMACYVAGAQASNPFLISPVGTMPLQRCLGQ